MINDVIYQLINVTTGCRSQVFSGSLGFVAAALAHGVPEDLRSGYAVLVVGESVDGDWIFSQAPYMGLSTFINSFYVGEAGNG